MMENLKVKVNNEVESKEAQELFFELGYAWLNTKKEYQDIGRYNYISSFNYSNRMELGMGCGAVNHKEVTIDQLRDMVVLKRNNVGDATHNFHGLKFFLSSDEKVYQFMNTGWFETDDDHKIVCRFPIQNNDLPFIDSEKDVKEYLDYQGGWSYKLITLSVGGCIDRDWIEVPEGACSLTKCGDTLLFWNHDETMCMNPKIESSFRQFNYGGHAEYFKMNSHTMNKLVLWKRNPQEESLNDKVASAEEARQKQPNKKTIDVTGGVKLMKSLAQFNNTDRGADFDNFELFEKHSHYKKDVSHLEFIDVYRVLDLFGVESHAVGHAIKKLLCSGQRGAKDKAQDIQEAIDSLNRELEMMRENESSKD